MRYSLFAVVMASALTAFVAGHADTLIVEELDSAQASAAERPRRGMSMDKVQSTWGEPVSRRNAVGDPPISRWEYPGFVVYFEYSHVIHAVHKR